LIFPKIENKDYSVQNEHLSKKVVRGGAWVIGLRIINRGFGFVRTIILARLLTPNDFGILGISLLAIAILETFSQTGFQAALIQKKEHVENYLDTAWTVSVFRGIILFTLLFLSAPFVARFFGSPDALRVIRIIAISVLLTGFQNIGIMFFQRELEFNKQFLYELSGTLTDFAIAIVLAFVLKSVWALVWGILAANACRLFVSYIVHSYRPKFRFEKEQFKELFSFGQWILGSSVLTFLVTQGDDIFVGKVLGVTALGLYQMAFLISNIPATEISHVISRVTFPAYSRLQYQTERLGEVYLKVLKVTVCISAPIAGSIYVLAPDFTKIFLGTKWLPIVPIIKLLVITGFIRSIAATIVPLFHGTGKPNIDMIGQIIRLLVLAALIFPLAVRWNLAGVSISVLGSTLAILLFFIIAVVRNTGCGLIRFGRILLFPIIYTIAMSILLFLIKAQIQSVDFPFFITLIVCGMMIYVLIAYLMDKIVNYQIFSSIKEIISLT
jgi:O-antigen/teichoic acid export membrane protein